MPELFNSGSIKLTLKQVVREIIGFMKADPERKYAITIGTDSEMLSDMNADFVNAIVVHRVGNGARYFWKRGTLGKFPALRPRILQEVILSLETAEKFVKLMKEEEVDAGGIEWSFEVHADVGENGDTKVMLQEVVGMIRGFNFVPRTKPMSYAASNVADRHT